VACFEHFDVCPLCLLWSSFVPDESSVCFLTVEFLDDHVSTIVVLGHLASSSAWRSLFPFWTHPTQLSLFVCLTWSLFSSSGDLPYLFGFREIAEGPEPFDYRRASCWPSHPIFWPHSFPPSLQLAAVCNPPCFLFLRFRFPHSPPHFHGFCSRPFPLLSIEPLQADTVPEVRGVPLHGFRIRPKVFFFALSFFKWRCTFSPVGRGLHGFSKLCLSPCQTFCSRWTFFFSFLSFSSFGGHTTFGSKRCGRLRWCSSISGEFAW